MEENRAFKQAQQFPFPLLSDTDKDVGRRYDVLRAPDEQYADFPLRIAYLIDPAGTIVRAYQVSDVAGFADEVLGDLKALQGN